MATQRDSRQHTEPPNNVTVIRPAMEARDGIIDRLMQTGRLKRDDLIQCVSEETRKQDAWVGGVVDGMLEDGLLRSFGTGHIGLSAGELLRRGLLSGARPRDERLRR